MIRMMIAAAASLAALTMAAHAQTSTPPARGCPLAPPSGVTCNNGGGSTASQNDYVGLPSGTFGGGELYQYSNANPGVGFSYEGGQSTPAQQAVRDNTPSSFTGNLSESGYAVHFGASESYVNSASPLYNYVGPNHPLPGGGGQFLQIPMWATTDVIPINNAKMTFNGAFVLNDNDLCGIFSGLVTNWSQTSASAKAKAGTIKVYWRADNAGASASFQLTQHLAAVCTNSNTKPGITFKLTSKFASLFPGVVTPPSDGTTKWSIPVGGDGSFSNFAAVSGSAGMADGVNNDATGSAIGYVSPDYSAIAPSPIPSGKTKQFTKLFVASLVNKNNNVAYLPNSLNLSLAMSNPGSATISGPPSVRTSAAAIQTNWAPQISTPAKGYPIINMSLLFVPQCFASQTVADAIIQVITNNINHVYDNALISSGFYPAQSGGENTWGGAVFRTFVGNYYNLNLNINNATACASVTKR